MKNLYPGSVSILSDLRDKYFNDSEIIEEFDVLIGYYSNYVMSYPEIHDSGYPVCISEYYFNDYPLERAYDEMEDYYVNGEFDDDEINERMYEKLDVILESYDDNVSGKLTGKEFFDRWLMQVPDYRKKEAENNELTIG